MSARECCLPDGGLAALLLDHAEDFLFAHHQVLVAVDLDFLAGVLAEQDDVARLDVERGDPAVLLDAALADGNDLALLRLFLGGIRDDDAADLLFRVFNTLDDHSVVQWSHLHDGPLSLVTVPAARASARDRPAVSWC